MIFSNELLLSDNQAITGDAVSTNIIDLGAQGTPHGDAAALNMDKGKVSRIPFLLQVTEDFDNLTSLTVTVEKDTETGFGSAEDVWSHTFLAAELVAGTQLPFDILSRNLDQRYIRLDYDVTGTAPTTGKIMAGVVAAVQNN